MTARTRLAIIGLGRIGEFHALHAQELAEETGNCELVAVADVDRDRAEAFAGRIAARQSGRVHAFASVEELLAADVCQAAVISSPTACHREHAELLVRAGLPVLLEKPLTGCLEEARQLASFLRERQPPFLMLAFQRRFDDALVHARSLLAAGRIGRPFKIVSVLEDSGPPPDGYNSPGLLRDMSVHNVDEVLWLTGERPTSTAGFGSRLYGHRVASVDEDYDDALLSMWFETDLLAEVHVSRNHVCGYRTETWIFGEEGSIHVGRFEQDARQIVVEAYGRSAPIERRTFALRDYRRPVPEFVARFGAAYKAELAYFIEHSGSGAAYSVNQEDGLRAMEVIEAGMRSLRDRESGVRVEYS